MSSSSMGQAYDLTGKLRDVSGTRVQQLIDNWDLATMIMGAKNPEGVDRQVFAQLLAGTLVVPGLTLHGDRFTPADLQVTNLRLWMRTFFRKEQIDEVAAAAPEFAWDQPLVALTLCWTMNTLQQTVDAKLDLLRRIYGQDKLCVSPELRTDPEHLMLADGAPEFVPNQLRWEVIDLGANRNTAATSVDAATAAGIQILDVACQHKAYITSQDGCDVPYTDVPGLRVDVPGGSKPYMMYLHGYSDGDLNVEVRWADRRQPGCARPVVLREPACR